MTSFETNKENRLLTDVQNSGGKGTAHKRIDSQLPEQRNPVEYYKNKSRTL